MQALLIGRKHMFPGTLKKSFKSARFLSDILKHFVQAALELVHVIILINDTLKLFHFAGVCPQSPKEICVKEGEIVAEFFKECDHNETLWRSFTKQGMHLHNNTPAAEHRQMGVMVQQGILVILSASEKNEGNYSCSLK